MDLNHHFRVPASVEQTWTAFNHLDRLAPCFPGASVSDTSGDHFEGLIKVKLGPMALVYAGSGQFLERNLAARRVVFEARGAERRGNGTATARVTASFVGHGSATEVELRTNLDLTGRPAQFGRGVIADVGDKLLDQFATCVAERLADGLGLAAVATDRRTEQSVAADDELWEEWAAAGPPAEVEASDTEQTIEMTTVGAPDPARATATPPPAHGSTLSSPVRSRVGVAVSAALTGLRRYGPLLAFLALAVLVVAKLVARRRR